jgi:tetratricopeptide (TPR) repeat protein
MKMKVRLFLLAALLITTTVEASTFSTDGFPDGKPQNTQSRYGSDSVTCVTNISLYREFFKQWKSSDYTNAAINEIVKPWKWVFNNCPLGSENTYVDGVKIMQYRIENEKNAVARAQYIDTLMHVYDQRIQYFPNHYKTGKSQEGAILGRKGVDLYTYNADRYKEAYDILHKSINLEGDNSDGTVMIYYFRSVIKMARNGQVDSASIVDVYDRVIEILDHNINSLTAKGDTRWVEIYKNFKGNIDATFEPFATCEDLVRIYKNKMSKTPDDIELLKKVTAILDRSGCQTDPLYLTASVNLHKLEPSPESAYNIGRLMLKDEKLNEALPYFEEASKSTDLNKSQTSFKMLSEIYRALKNYPRSRQMALKAIELNPNDGGPYITIGNLYAASAKDCGKDDFSSRAAYWAAVDKFIKARNVDPSVAEAANGLIAAYSAYFPTKETIFFNDYKEGAPYTIECWFTEETTIRAAK